MNIGELVALLRIDDSQLEAGISRGEQRMRNMSTAAKAAGGAAGAALGAGLATAMTNAISLDSANAKVSAQLGLTAVEAEQAGKLAGDLYGAGMGDSIETVNGAIQGVAQNMGVALDSVDMEPLTKKALTLSSVFGIDVAESTRAAGNMMRNLGMDGAVAMDAVAGITEKYGLRSEDLLDTLEEYPVQFQKLGLSGEQTFGMLDQALEGNARNTDIAADALKEFSIRSVDGSAAAAKSFEALGFNAEEMTATFAKGGPEAAAALDQVFDELRKTEGQAGAAEIAFGLFGTQSEDLGRALYEIDPSEATGRIGEMTGTLDEAGQKMADTAEKKVLKLQRGFEQLTAGMIATEGPMGMVAAAVASFGPAAISMAGSFAMIAMAAGPLIVRMFALAGSAISTAATWAMSMLGMAANAALAVGRIIVSLLLWTAQTIAQGAIAVASMAASAARYVAAWVLMGIQAMLQAARMAAAWLIAMGPVGWVIAAVVGLVALIVANWDTIVAWTTDAWGKVSAFISDTWNAIVAWISTKIAEAVTTVTNGWNRAVEWTKAAWTNLVVAVKNGGTNAVNWVRGLPGMILGALGNVGSMLYNSGSALISGFWDGLVARWNQLMSWVRGAMGNLRALWPFSPAKDGPFSGSGYVTHSGRALTGDFADSLRKGMPGVVDAARSVMDGTHTALTPELDGRRSGLPGDGWLSRAAPTSTSTREGDRVVQVTVNNPVAEKASDTLGRRARSLAALGPHGGGRRG